jgi:hypothetical protein
VHCTIVLFVLLLKISYIIGQVPSVATIDFISGANCYSKNFVDVFSIVANPACIPTLQDFQMGVRAQRRYSLAELDQYTICFSASSKLGAFALQVNYQGSGGYHETQPGLAYAKSLGNVQMGIQFNYSSMSIAGYGSTGRLVTEFGTIWHLTDQIHTGFEVQRSISLVKRYGKISPAYAFSTGIGYEVSPFVFLGFTVFKEDLHAAIGYIGIHYQFAQQFFARLGINVRTAEASLSAGWKWNRLRVELTSAYHFQLGVSPGLMMIYQAVERKK